MANEQTIFEYSLNGSNGDFIRFSKCPSEYTHEFFQMTTESHRNVGKGAYLRAELLATKNKFSLTWYELNADEYAALAKLKYNVMFYWIKTVDPANPVDPKTKEVVPKVFSMYNGDLKGNARHAEKETGRIDSWKSITLNLIER